MADAASSLEKQALERKEKLRALKARKTEKKDDAEKEVEEYVDKFNHKRVYIILGEISRIDYENRNTYMFLRIFEYVMFLWLHIWHT